MVAPPNRGPDPTSGIPTGVEQEKHPQKIQYGGLVVAGARSCRPHFSPHNYVGSGKLEPKKLVRRVVRAPHLVTSNYVESPALTPS